MSNNPKVYWIDHFDPQYIPSKSIISLVDLLSFIQCDGHLKIAYMIFNMNCKLMFYSGVKGFGMENDERVQLFPLSGHINNHEGYVLHVNHLFFRKEDVCAVIDSDNWITFSREGVRETLCDIIKKTIYTICNHPKDKTYNCKHRFSFYSCKAEVEFFNEINNNYETIQDIQQDNLFIDYLAEYTPSLAEYIDMFGEAKKYFQHNIPKNEFEELKLIIDIKNKFKLSDKKIATIVYEKELTRVDIDTLAKRVQRKIKKACTQSRPEVS